MARDCYDDCIAFLDEQLGRLLDELRGQGLLENTLVIITSDHGEAFGDHGYFGHGFSLYLDVIGVPLVILSPARRRAASWPAPSACATCRPPWSTCSGLYGRLTVSGPARWPAYWQSASGRQPERTTSPAFSEKADATTFQPQPASVHGYSGLQMSLVASGLHYLRDGAGAEILYDLARDPFELYDLSGTSRGEAGSGGLPTQAPRSAHREPRLTRGGSGLSGAVPPRSQGPRPGTVSTASRRGALTMLGRMAPFCGAGVPPAIREQAGRLHHKETRGNAGKTL